jgi:two-component system sensor histidine kinase RegB
VPLSELLAEVARPHENLGKSIVISKAPTAGPDPVFRRNVGLLYGLGNLIENATSYARSSVTVETAWDVATITIVITDDGPGFQPDLIDRLGEPYLTTRPRQPATAPADTGGLGLGIFIAKTLLERTGAHLDFKNAEPDTHAQVTVTWPRDAIETAGRLPEF